jgi:hypothetical protein
MNDIHSLPWPGNLNTGPRLPSPPEPATSPEFTELCRLEPKLEKLAADARSERERARGKRRYCANAAWYCGGLRARLIALAGWHSRHPEPLMRTSAAYDVAYDAIYNMLPDCRGCGCW